ncbi:MAG: hypothetical protein GX750_08625 [Clostridia bacterium]|nr:hypothetical protein [Clostridia bacterium]
MLNYRKPGFWVIIVALVALVAVSVKFMSNLREKQLSIEDYANQFIDRTIAGYNTGNFYFEILDRKITKLEKIASFDELVPEAVLERMSIAHPF